MVPCVLSGRPDDGSPISSRELTPDVPFGTSAPLAETRCSAFGLWRDGLADYDADQFTEKFCLAASLKPEGVDFMP